ncbi:MAG: diguanylate cyclase [Burkholderiaceae bacterium]
MAEQEQWDDELRALDRLAEEQGARALSRIEGAVRGLREAGDRDRLVWALPPLARALALCERLDAAEAAANEALAHFRVTGSARGQAFALNALGIVAWRRGVPSRVLELTGEAVVLARAADEPVLQVRIANTLGAVLNDIGRLPESVQILEEGLRASRGFPDEAVVLRLRANLALALARWALREFDERLPESAWRPRAERAIEVMRPAIDAWRKRGRPELLSNVLENLAVAHIVLGRLEDAHATLDEAERLMDPASARHSIVFFSCVRARAHLQAGEPLLALQAVERGRAAADARGGHIYMDEVHRLKSLAHEARGELREALDAYKRFHELRTRLVLERAEQQASALAITLNTERALRQVSEERDRAERAHREARHDQLTGLANRRRFDEYLAGMLPRATDEQPISLVLIDLDHFKSINDRYRHLAGDAALRWVARHLQAQCRQVDLPARLGGDEFALVLNAPLAVAHQVCTRLRVAVAGRSSELPSDVTIRLSAGIAEATAPCDPQHLFRRADEALYAAKAGGRDGVRHDGPGAGVRRTDKEYRP